MIKQRNKNVNLEVDYRRKSLIEQAAEEKVANTGWIFRRITKFFADRKFITIAFVHLTITLVIFSKWKAMLRFLYNLVIQFVLW